jgi:hypothetical protein
MLVFTHLARIAAVLGAILGVWSIWLGYVDSTREYLGYLDSTGTYNAPLTKDQIASLQRQSRNSVEMGIIVLLGSIALGVLAEISFSVRKK